MSAASRVRLTQTAYGWSCAGQISAAPYGWGLIAGCSAPGEIDGNPDIGEFVTAGSLGDRIVIAVR